MHNILYICHLLNLFLVSQLGVAVSFQHRTAKIVIVFVLLIDRCPQNQIRLDLYYFQTPVMTTKYELL